MELIDRIKYVMKLNNLSSSGFADEIGVQRSSISHVLSGRNKPSLEFVQKVLKQYPKVDANWLVSGIIPNSTTKEKIKVDSENSITKQEKLEANAPSVNSGLGTIKLEKQVKRVMLFYEDGTFKEFNSAKF